MKTTLCVLFVVTALGLIPAMSDAQTFLTAEIHGDQEVPAVTTSASGTGSFVLNPARTELTYDITVDGLSGPIAASHFHKAPAGVAGGVVRAITFNGNTASGVWKSSDTTQPLTPALVADLLAGNLYVNVHTADHPGGESRGQVNVAQGFGFMARLEGAQEVPAVTTSAMGSAFVVLNRDKTEVEYHITVTGLSEPIAAAHFHKASAGVAGGVVRATPFEEGNTAEGGWKSDDATQPLTSALVAELMAGNLYLNVHTAANPGGEIRGQVNLVSRGGLVGATDDLPPAPVTDLKAEDTPDDKGGSITVTWAKSSDDRIVATIGFGGYAATVGIPGVTAYRVYRKTGGEAAFKPIATLDAGSESYVDDTVQNGVPYIYTVRASDGTNESPEPNPTAEATARNNQLPGLFPGDDTPDVVDAGDFNTFVSLFASGDIQADLNGDGVLDIDDFLTILLNLGKTAGGASKTIAPAFHPEAGMTFAALPGTGSDLIVEVGLTGASEAKGYGFTLNYDPSALTFSKALNAGTVEGTPIPAVAAHSSEPGRLNVVSLRGTEAIRLSFRRADGAGDPAFALTDAEVLNRTGRINLLRAGAVVRRPTAYALRQNWPNPFNPETTIAYDLPQTAFVDLTVYNLSGQRIRALVSAAQSAGAYTVRWDGRDDRGRSVATGVYLYRLSTPDFTHTRKMTLVR